MKRLMFVTGLPRTGKTTTLLRAAEKLRTKGYRMGGMVSQEIRERDIRVGFEIRDYASDRRGWLAHIYQPVGPKVGKYRVNLESLNSIGATSILNALKDADVVLIDEVGPMELFSRAFKEAVQEAIRSSKPVLGTIHYCAKHCLVKQIRSRNDTDIIEVTQENRDQLPALIVDKIIKLNR